MYKYELCVFQPGFRSFITDVYARFYLLVGTCFRHIILVIVIPFSRFFCVSAINPYPHPHGGLLRQPLPPRHPHSFTPNKDESQKGISIKHSLKFQKHPYQPLDKNPIEKPEWPFFLRKKGKMTFYFFIFILHISIFAIHHQSLAFVRLGTGTRIKLIPVELLGWSHASWQSPRLPFGPTRTKFPLVFINYSRVINLIW